MAAPQLLPEDFDPEEIEDESGVIDISDQFEEDPEEYDEVGAQDSDEGEEIDGRDRFEELNEQRERHKEKQEARKQKKEAKEQEKLRTDDSKKPPKQEPKPESPELKQKKEDKARDAADRVKSGEKKLAKNTGEKAASQGGEAVAKAGKEAVAAVEKQGAKAIAKAEAQAAVQGARAALAATVEIWGPILIVVVIIAVIIAAVFIAYSFSSNTGKGPAIYPETALQQQQSNFLLAVSGDKIAQDTIVKDVIEGELGRYDRIKNNADSYNPELSASISAKKTEFDTLLNSALAEQSPELRKEILDDTRSQMLSFENTLPFGSWIASLAKDRIGQPNLQFCSITGAGAKVACASFVSTVMYLAGVPNAIVGLVDDVWNNSSTRVIIPKPAAKSSTYYQENVNKLQPGDIIFWGDGNCSPRGSVIFDHVGFYIGNGKTADTSFSQEKVLSRSADKIDSCRVFNGAKRYGR